MLSRSMASLNTARRLNMQQYEIGITLLSQEAHTPESRSNTLAWTIRAYELALLSRVSLPTSYPISLFDFPLRMYLSLALLRSLVGIYIYIYREFISIKFTPPLKRSAISLCAGFRNVVLENGRYRLTF